MPRGKSIARRDHAAADPASSRSNKTEAASAGASPNTALSNNPRTMLAPMREGGDQLNPATEPLEHRVPRPELAWQIAPKTSRARDPEHLLGE